jgi:hypothetical protein
VTADRRVRWSYGFQGFGNLRLENRVQRPGDVGIGIAIEGFGLPGLLELRSVGRKIAGRIGLGL